MNSASRPNILVIQADQLTAKVLPMYGHPLLRPHSRIIFSLDYSS